MNETTIVIDDHRFGEAMRRAPGRITERVEQALMCGAQEVARAAQGRVPKAFSRLWTSIIAQRIGDLHYRVSTGTNYARAVEEGRKPGKMPGTSNGLMEWVKQKTSLQGTALERATFLIARGIARKGIKAQPYMAPAVTENRSRVVDLVRAATTKGIEEAFRG